VRLSICLRGPIPAGLVLGALAAAGSLAAPSPSPRPAIYLLAGQSNMSGRGLVEDLSAAERAADPAIRLYGNDGRVGAALDPLDDPAGQVDAVSADPKAAVGPGLFFARALRAVDRRPIVLVPCAKGGSAMAEWTPSPGRGALYGSCLARARAAVAATGGRLAGVLWYQGETDAGLPERAAVWGEALNALVARLRADLAQPRLAVVVVQLADPPSPEISAPRTYPAWSAVQAQQAGPLPACAAMVPARGLPKKEDDMHLTTAAQRVLGPRLAQAMIGLQREGCR
jgi:hypothetical protein